MEYDVAFDVIQSGNRHRWFPMLGLFLVFIGIMLVLFRKYVSVTAPKMMRSKFSESFHGPSLVISEPVLGIFSWSFLGFGIFWTLFAFLGTSIGSSDLASALREGRCEVTEGVVSDFHPLHAMKSGTEWFIVNGKRFEYSDAEITAGFNNTASHGGPIRKGLQVRLHHLGNDIARLEVAK